MAQKRESFVAKRTATKFCSKNCRPLSRQGNNFGIDGTCERNWSRQIHGIHNSLDPILKRNWIYVRQTGSGADVDSRCSKFACRKFLTSIRLRRGNRIGSLWNRHFSAVADCAATNRAGIRLKIKWHFAGRWLNDACFFICLFLFILCRTGSYSGRMTFRIACIFNDKCDNKIKRMQTLSFGR